MIHVVSDALKVVHELNGDEDWCIGNFVKDILEMLKLFVAIKFSFVSRKANRAAHNLAKFSFVHEESFKWGWFFSYTDCLL